MLKVSCDLHVGVEMSAKRVGKRIVASLAMEAIMEGIRGYLEELLEPVTPEQLYVAMKKGVNLWDFAPSKVKRRGSTWTRNFRKYQDRLTPALVLEWLHEDRPDLHSLIINMPGGTKWLARMTGDIKERLWPPEEGGLKLVQVPQEEEEPEKPEEPPEEPPAKIKYI